MESYAAVRRFVFAEGHSPREASRVLSLSRETVSKMCRFSLPPGYTRKKPVGKPKLDREDALYDAILSEISAGSLKGGDRLKVSELAKRHGLSADSGHENA